MVGFLGKLWRRRALAGAALMVATVAGVAGSVGSASGSSGSVASGAALGARPGFRPTSAILAAQSRRVPFARGQAPVAAVGGEVTWMRRADSDTFVAGSGRLLTKIYPFAVNYKTSSGAFAPIKTGLVASGAGYGQEANDLGVLLPKTAAGQARVSDSAGGLAFGLSGAAGAGAVSGATERFAGALAGVDLTYSSLNSGIGWKATLSSAAAKQGLSWVLSASSGLTAKLVSGGVAFRNAAGKVAWVFQTPTVQTESGRPVPVRLSLSSSAQGTVIRTAPAAASPAASASKSAAMVAPAAATSGSPTEWNGLVAPGTTTYLGPGHQTGDCYIDSNSPDTSFCLGDTNYVGPNDHTLINFDVADNLPSHVQVLESYASMELTSESSSTPEQVGVWQAAQPWTNLATWNSYDGTNDWTTPGGDTTGPIEDTQTVGASGDLDQNFYWNIPASMQGWVDGNPPQVDGLIFEATDGSSAPNTLGFGTETSSDAWAYLGVYYEPRLGGYPGARYDSQQLTDRSTLGVNVGTGNLLVSNTDLNLAGVNGLNVNLGRYYNNLSTDQDSFGTGWSMGNGADTYLSIPSDGNATVDYFDGTGSAQAFYVDGTGQQVNPPGLDAQVTMDDGGSTWGSSTFTILFRHSGITETFTAPADTLPKIAQLSTLSDRNGNTIHYYYNSSGQLDHLVDSYGQTTSFTYSPEGYVSEITDPTGREYKYFQNSSGQLTQYEDPAGNTTNYTYDGYGNLTQITTPQGNKITMAYDAGNTNEVTSVTRYVQPTDSSGPQTTYQFATASGTCPADPGWTQGTVKDPNGHVTTYCTGEMSRIQQTIDANGHSRSVSYSPDGYVQELTSGQNTPTAFTYSTDGNDNITQIQQGAASGSQLTTQLNYDTSGPNPYLPSKTTDPQGNSISYGYDGNGNQTSQTDQLAAQDQATMTYNSDGTAATSTDADGNETSYGYTDGNLTTITPPSGSGLNPISVSYDSANRVSEISSVVAGVSGHEVDYTYDPLDRITKAVYKDDAGNIVETVCYSYDNDGNLILRTDIHGATSYVYDGLDRMTSETFPDNSSDYYSYDPAGNLTYLEDAGGTVTYGYDKANQLTSVTDPGASRPEASMTYDADGNLLNTTYLSGASVARTYNAFDQLTKVTDTYKTSSGTTAHLSYAYSYTQDSADTELIQTMTDQAGNTTTYRYDALNRLTQASTAGPNPSSYTYTNDGVGNLTSVDANGSTTSYTYNPGNEIATANGVDYTYDADGNQTSAGAGLTMTYNALEQTTSITSGGTTTAYTYLGEGQTQPATEDGNSLHNDILGLASHPTSGGTAYFTRSISGQQIDERTPTGTYNYLLDGQGSIVGITDSAAHLVNQYRYDPYGNRTTIGASAPDYFGFQAGYTTPAGLTHYAARYYDPTQGSWTQQDPKNQLSTLTQDDRYEYADSDPTNNTDPTGEGVNPNWLERFQICIGLCPIPKIAVACQKCGNNGNPHSAACLQCGAYLGFNGVWCAIKATRR